MNVQCHKGFTMVELLIAVAIVALGASLAAPEFLRWHARTQLRQATSEIASELTMARMAAMNRNRTVDVTIQVTGGTVTIMALPSGGSSVMPSKTLASRVTAVTGAPVTVSFSPLGLRTSAGTATQSFGVCDINRTQYSVQIIPAGRVNWFPTATATPCP